MLSLIGPYSAPPLFRQPTRVPAAKTLVPAMVEIVKSSGVHTLGVRGYQEVVLSSLVSLWDPGRSRRVLVGQVGCDLNDC